MDQNKANFIEIFKHFIEKSLRIPAVVIKLDANSEINKLVFNQVMLKQMRIIRLSNQI